MSSRVPATPVVLIVINGQGVRVNGVLVLHAPNVDLRQVGIRAAAERVATVHGRPVRAVLTDEALRLRLVVHPDASVSDVEVDPTFEPAAPSDSASRRAGERPAPPSTAPLFPPPFALPPAVTGPPVAADSQDRGEAPTAAQETSPAPAGPDEPVEPVEPVEPGPRRAASPPAVVPVAGPARHRSSRWRRTGLVAAAVVLLGGSGAWVLTRSGGTTDPVAGPTAGPSTPTAPSSGPTDGTDGAGPPADPGPTPLRGVQVDVTGPRPRTVRVEVSAPLPAATSVAVLPDLHLRMVAADGPALTRVLRLTPVATPAVAVAAHRAAARGPHVQGELLLRGLDAGRYRWRLTAPGLDPITGRVRVIPVPVATVPVEPTYPTYPTTPATPSTPSSPSSPSTPSSPSSHPPSHPQAPHSPSVPPGPVDPHGS